MAEMVEMAEMVDMGRCQRWWAIKGWKMSRWSRLRRDCQGWRLVMLERGWRDVNSSKARGGMMPQRENTPLYALGLPCSEGGGRRSTLKVDKR